VSRPPRAVPWIAAGWLAVSAFASAEPSLERSIASVLETGESPSGFALGARLGDPGNPATRIRAEDLQAAAVDAAQPPAETYVSNPPPKRRPFWIGAVTFATIAGSAANSFTDSGGRSFHFYNENWFGKHTYAGGADKVSHFTLYNIVGHLVGQVYGELGMSESRAAFWGAAVSALAGLTTEIGDGTNKYGFSYEDLVSDVAGAATAYVTTRYGLNDLLGFRIGYIPHPDVVGQPYGGTGKDYTEEIYAADIKICGLAKRLHFNPGIARFLVFSTTYGVKGYPYAAPEVRERQIGLEVGLHVSEILRAAGLQEDRWWKRVLYVLVDSVRIPYTQIGVQYDLNHKAWRGPGIGDDFPGGGPKVF
jgi:uncharacterized protein YfiM (DUF2279 family)